MPKKKAPAKRKKKAPVKRKGPCSGVKVCLDELEHAYVVQAAAKTPLAKRDCTTWIRVQKERLKAYGYKGKVPRKPRSDKEK